MSEKPVYNHAVNPDETTIEQFQHCVSQPYVQKAALMPDAHPGYVAPVGAVLVTEGYIVPAWVGYDIGCGMTAVKLDVSVEEAGPFLQDLFENVHEAIPMGKGEINGYKEVSARARRSFEVLLDQFLRRPYHNDIKAFFEGSAIRHLGSLGSGNHFIEFAEGSEGTCWIIVHSGSRGVGHRVAKRYMKRSAGDDEEFEATHPLDVTSNLGKEYRNILRFGLGFAEENRMEMARRVIRELQRLLGRGINWEVWASNNHNHAVEEDGLFIHRKGATPAKQGERGIIPGNMRDGTYLVAGKGNKEFLQSSTHGAGRVMSRGEAKQRINVDRFVEQMKGVVSDAGESVLDEAPDAYKDLGEVMEAQQSSVDIEEHLVPLVNWKGG